MIEMMTRVAVSEKECCVSTTTDCIDWQIFDRDDGTCSSSSSSSSSIYLLLWARKIVAWLQTLTALIGECMVDMMTLVVVGEEECCVTTTIGCIAWRVYGRY